MPIRSLVVKFSTVERPTRLLRQFLTAPLNTTIGRFFAAVVGTMFVVGCGQTSLTSPSSLIPSASSVGDARVTASTDSPLDIPLGAWNTLRASVVSDARGDVVPASTSPYLDVVHANVIEQGHETLRFMMVLAGPIPETPSEPFLLWVFHVDTAPGTAGTPPLYNEYIVRVRWQDGAFAGEVIDRTGPPPQPVSFSIDGATVKLSVPLSLLGNSSSFGWNAATRPQPPANYLDFAPNGGTVADLVTWTSKE
jgi:hypothetical protein